MLSSSTATLGCVVFPALNKGPQPRVAVLPNLTATSTQPAPPPAAEPARALPAAPAPARTQAPVPLAIRAPQPVPSAILPLNLKKNLMDKNRFSLIPSPDCRPANNPPHRPARPASQPVSLPISDSNS